LLLLSLAGALALLVGTKAGVLNALGIGTDSAGTGSSAWCIPSGSHEPARVDLEQVGALRKSLGGVLRHPAGGRLAEGVVSPDDVWSDDAPQSPSSMVAPGGLWPAGYEIRWLTRRYTVVADVFVFTTERAARKFFEEAAGTSCHREGSESPASTPPGGRNLTWTNPDGVEQSDVFFMRGRWVYRMSDVLDTNAIPLSPQGEAEVLDARACRMPDAECPAAAKDGAVQAQG
jgi:hypothetical protein